MHKQREKESGGIKDSPLGILISKRHILGMIAACAFCAFLFFWFLHWLTSGPTEAVEDKKKEEWSNERIKFKMGNIRVGLRIMPSANTENNIIIMDYIRNTKEEQEGGNVDKSYHAFENTVDYFPSLNFYKEYVPFGDPEPFCFHLSWSPIDRSRISELYKPFEGMNRWVLVNKGHRLWPKDDPKTGIDIKMWKEDVYSIGECGTQEECQYQCESKFHGLYKNGKCYAYMVVESLCFKVSEENNQDLDPDNDQWRIKTGCYKDGAYAKMVKAVPGFEYNFNSIPVEVRAYSDPFAGKAEEEEKEAKDPSRTKSSFSFWKFLMWVAFIVFIIFLILTVVAFVLIFLEHQKDNSDHTALRNNPDSSSSRL